MLGCISVSDFHQEIQQIYLGIFHAHGIFLEMADLRINITNDNMFFFLFIW